MGVEEEDLQVVSIDVDVILENCPITIMLYVIYYYVAMYVCMVHHI